MVPFLPESQAMLSALAPQQPQGPLPPDVQAQLMALSGRRDEQAILQQQLAQAQALMGQTAPRRTTGAGAALSGLGAGVRQIAGLGQQMQATNRLRDNSQAQAQARRAFGEQALGASTPEARQRLVAMGLLSGDETLGRYAQAESQTLGAEAQRAFVGGENEKDRAAAAARLRAEMALREKEMGLRERESLSKVEREREEKAAKQTDDLRKEFAGLPQTKRIVEVNESMAKVRAASNGGAGDLSLVYGYMKLLDPGSAVKEGEFANASKTEGIPGEILALRARIFAEGMLTPAARANLKREAETLFKAHRSTFEPTIKAYKSIAESRGLDLGMALPELGLGEEAPQGDWTPEKQKRLEELRQKKARGELP